MKGNIHSFETFGTVDGPGIRFVIFMMGCKYRCKYCHNPDTWLGTGNLYEPNEVMEKISRYLSYFEFSDGGITISGGEPLLQIDFLIELCKLAKKQKIHVAIDTAGYYQIENELNKEKLDILLDYVDLILLDIKEIDAKKHEYITGYSNDVTLNFAMYVSNCKKVPMIIRYVLVPGISDDKDDILELKKFVSTLDTVQKIEILPYHTLGVIKWEKLGLEYKLKDIKPPTELEVDYARKLVSMVK